MQSVHALKLLAWVTTCRGTSTRPSSSASYCMPYRHGGVIRARPTSNVSKQLYDVLSGSACIQRTILCCPNSLLTWTIIFLRTYWTILVKFCINWFQTTLNILTISDLCITLFLRTFISLRTFFHSCILSTVLLKKWWWSCKNGKSAGQENLLYRCCCRGIKWPLAAFICHAFYVNFVPVVYILYYSCVGNKLFQELVELVRTKKLAQAAAASTKKNWIGLSS